MPARALSVRSMVNLGMSLLSLDEDEDLVAGDEGVAGFPLELAEGGRCAFGEVEGRLVGGGRGVAAGVLDPDAAYVRGLGAEGGALGGLREEAGEVGD